MSIVVSNSEIKEYEKLKIISQLTPIKEKIKFFERNMAVRLRSLRGS